MEDGSPLWGLLIFILLVVIHGIIHGFGAAIQNLNDSEIEKRAQGGDWRSKKLLHIINSPVPFINTMLTSITLTSMITGGYVYWIFRYFMEKLFLLDSIMLNQYFEKVLAILIPMFLLLFLLMIFGVIVPKKLAKRYSMQWSYGFLGIISFISAVLLPVTKTVTIISGIIIRFIGLNPDEEYDNVTEEDIMSMVNEGHEQGVLLASEAEMITNIFELGDKHAEDIMTHRKNMVTLDASWTLEETIRFILEQNNSRFPVEDEDIDDIIGILHFKDAMIAYEQMVDKRNIPIRDIPDLMLDVNFIPETRSIHALFKEMQLKKMHMVIVIDEYGQTAGLITMEDILEEIVGSIMDEYDEEETMIICESEDSYVIHGMADLEEVADILKIEFEEAEEYDTLNGFLVSKLDRIPQEGEELLVEYGGYRFMVLQVENKTIHSVRVERLESAELFKEQ